MRFLLKRESLTIHRLVSRYWCCGINDASNSDASKRFVQRNVSIDHQSFDTNGRWQQTMIDQRWVDRILLFVGSFHLIRRYEMNDWFTASFMLLGPVDQRRYGPNEWWEPIKRSTNDTRLYFLHSFRPPRNTTKKWPERNIEGNNLLEVSDVDLFLLFKNMLLSPGESSVNVWLKARRG